MPMKPLSVFLLTVKVKLIAILNSIDRDGGSQSPPDDNSDPELEYGPKSIEQRYRVQR